MSYSKHKDKDPRDTVKVIKTLYKEKLNLELELSVCKRVDGIYSATLSDRAAKWNTCGKGTTEDYCSASAYGESVEHLCNYFAYEIANLSTEANQAYGFERYPDEIEQTVEKIFTECPQVILDLQEAYKLATGRNCEEQRLISLWKEFLGKERIPFVPYYSLRTKQYVNIPENLVFYLCGSNGGGAGNTPEEAIGHACDEILERYVKFNIYMNGLTPPVVPRSYVQKRCPELIKIIDDLELHDGYKVIIKDASMGKGYSVLSVLLLNQHTSEYLVNFGAHPQFEIALERCLTELLQAFIPGKCRQRKSMEKWTCDTEKRFSYPQNWVTLLKDDSGAVPNSYFGPNSSWCFEEWPTYDNYSNKLGMKVQLQQLLTFAPDIYIHDVSYLGFPAYRVYVPTVSSSHMPFDEYQFKCYRAMEHFPDIVKNEDYSMDNLQKLYETIFNPKTFVSGLVFRSLGEKHLHLLHAALCFDLKKYDECNEYLRLSESEYGECLKRLTELIGKNIQTDEINAFLALFFDKKRYNFAEQWLSQGAFKSSVELYQKSGVSFSPRVDSSQERQTAINDLHIRLKRAMKESKKGETLKSMFKDFVI